MNAIFRKLTVAAVGGWILSASPVLAAESPASAPVQYSGRATNGAEIAVPSAGKVTVLAFLRAGQEQSDAAAKQIAQTLAKGTPGAADAQVVVVISGHTPADAVAKFVESAKIAWPVVLDPDYALSGKLAVRVWPTTVVVAADGTQAAHLAGLPASFASDLSAYLDFAGKKIDQTALDGRLTTKQVVADSPRQMAERHLRVASALLDRGDFDAAKSEIEQGLARVPGDASLRVLLVRTLIKQNQPDAALASADQLKDAVPPWQSSLLRAEALVALQRWPEAKLAAADSLKLNPNPAAAHYLAGVIASQEKDWERAAESFRKAYEAGLRVRDAQ